MCVVSVVEPLPAPCRRRMVVMFFLSVNEPKSVMRALWDVFHAVQDRFCPLWLAFLHYDGSCDMPQTATMTTEWLSKCTIIKRYRIGIHVPMVNESDAKLLQNEYTTKLFFAFRVWWSFFPCFLILFSQALQRPFCTHVADSRLGFFLWAMADSAMRNLMVWREKIHPNRLEKTLCTSMWASGWKGMVEKSKGCRSQIQRLLSTGPKVVAHKSKGCQHLLQSTSWKTFINSVFSIEIQLIITWW